MFNPNNISTPNYNKRTIYEIAENFYIEFKSSGEVILTYNNCCAHLLKEDVKILFDVLKLELERKATPETTYRNKAPVVSEDDNDYFG